MNMNTNEPRNCGKAIQEWTEQLENVLREMLAGQEKMLQVIKLKHEAMRSSDVAGMLQVSADEGTLASAILSIDKIRLDITARLSVLLKLGPAPVTIRSIASRLPAEAANRLLSVAAALRERMLKVAEANRVVELVCQRMLAHFKEIFSVVAQGADAPPTYTPSGNRNKQIEAMVLDAVG